jgi:3-hydroxybutyryl-CoA dehydrogenase
MGTIGVIGAGVMGSGVALHLASYGYQVLLKDINTGVLEKSKARIVKDIRMVQMMRPDLQGLTVEDVLGKIHFQCDYQLFDNVDIVIENVPEEWGIKAPVYGELAQVCGREVMYCVNTSCISITKIASLLPVPQQVVGMHFMNPVPLKEMVEVVKGHHTSAETIVRAKGFLKSLKKIAVVVNDYPGFVANRLSHLFMNEAAFLVQDQVAAAREVDLIFKKGYGHAMGPLETADLIGLDTVVQSLEILYSNYQDSKFRCCPLLRKMVEAGLLGKKSGEGFYKYNQ